MEKSLFSYCFAIVLFLGLNFNASAQLTNYATIPYSTGFENGTLDANWYTTSSGNNGRIQIWNSTSLVWSGDTAKAHTDSLWLGLDCNPGGTYITNEAWIGLDLSGNTNVRFQFWWAEWNDETEPQDGIYVSDNGGSNFTKVLDLNGASYTDLQWNYFDINLDSVNTFHGLSYTATYVVKLQQYDDYYLAGGNDGFLFDDINVVSTLATGMDAFSEAQIKIFPNPANEWVNVSLKGFSKDARYNLMSIDGKVLDSDVCHSDFIRLNLSNYDAHLFILNVIDNNNNKTYKIVKQ